MRVPKVWPLSLANYACYTWVAIKIGDQGAEKSGKLKKEAVASQNSGQIISLTKDVETTEKDKQVVSLLEIESLKNKPIIKDAGGKG